jgi:hypothetical protein
MTAKRFGAASCGFDPRLAGGDIHRDFKTKTHIGEAWRGPLHARSSM